MNKFLILITVILLFFCYGVPARGISDASRALDIAVAPVVADEVNQVETLQSRILYSILSLRFEEADSLLGIPAESDMQDPAWYYLENYMDFLDAMISGDRGSYETYLVNSSRRLDSIKFVGEQIVDSGNDPGYSVYQSSIHLQSTFLSAYHAENFTAARHFYAANRYLRQSEAEVGNVEAAIVEPGRVEAGSAEPGRVEAGSAEPGIGLADGLSLRNRGLISLLVGSAPEEYRWLLNVLGMRGEIEEGLGYLEKYLDNTTGPNRVEACLIYQIVFHSVKPGVRVVAGDCDCDSLTLCRYATALINLGSGNSKYVVEDLEFYKQDAEERTLPFIDLLLGESMLNGLDPDANKPLERFLIHYTGENYRHYALHKLSWHYLHSGNMNAYQQFRNKVVNAGEAYLDADRQALREALDTLPVNTGLLRARLLFDGGYLMEALEQLKDILVLQNSRDSLEHSYRLARIYDRLEERDLAIRYYEDVLSAGSAETWYFAPNAALQLGIIHETEGNTEKALEYYRTCLKINKSAYKKSIDYKARQGIRRLEN